MRMSAPATKQKADACSQNADGLGFATVQPAGGRPWATGTGAMRPRKRRAKIRTWPYRAPHLALWRLGRVPQPDGAVATGQHHDYAAGHNNPAHTDAADDGRSTHQGQ